MLFMKNAISSLMLELDSDDLPQSSRGALKNLLAQEVVELTNIPMCAENLINYEVGIIELRGNDPSNYLMNSNLSVATVLQFFYKNTYYADDGSRQIVPNLSVSELMVMLGVFRIIADTRLKSQRSYEAKLRATARKTGRKFDYYLRKQNGLRDLDDDLYKEEILRDKIKEESAFIEIVDANGAILEEQIQAILGLKPEQKTPENLDKIVRCSKRLALSYAKIKKSYSARRKDLPILLGDTLLLDCAGEDAERLSDVFQPKRSKNEFVKMLDMES